MGEGAAQAGNGRTADPRRSRPAPRPARGRSPTGSHQAQPRSAMGPRLRGAGQLTTATDPRLAHARSPAIERRLSVPSRGVRSSSLPALGQRGDGGGRWLRGGMRDVSAVTSPQPPGPLPARLKQAPATRDLPRHWPWERGPTARPEHPGRQPAPWAASAHAAREPTSQGWGCARQTPALTWVAFLPLGTVTLG